MDRMVIGEAAALKGSASMMAIVIVVAETGAERPTRTVTLATHLNSTRGTVSTVI
jgi:hypothetical protein